MGYWWALFAIFGRGADRRGGGDSGKGAIGLSVGSLVWAVGLEKSHGTHVRMHASCYIDINIFEGLSKELRQSQSQCLIA